MKSCKFFHRCRGWNPDIVRISLSLSLFLFLFPLSRGRWKRLLPSVHQPKIIESSLLIGYSEIFCGETCFRLAVSTVPPPRRPPRAFDSVRQRTNTRVERVERISVECCRMKATERGIFVVKRTEIIPLPSTSRVPISRILGRKYEVYAEFDL